MLRRSLRPFLLLLAPAVAVAVTPEDIEVLEKSVVRVIVSGGTGSGFIIAPEYVLTNHHVVKGARRARVASKYTPDNGLEAQVVWQSADLDLAALKVSGLSLPSVTLATAEPGKKENIWTLGYPGASDQDRLNLDAIATDGVVGAVQSRVWADRITALEVIQHSAVINPGNSGGPLLDECGRVVGVNTAGITDAQGIFFASRITEAIPHIERLGVTLQKAASSCTPTTGGGAALDSTARQQAKQAMKVSIIAGLVIGLLSLIAILLALRKPRRQVAKVIERASRFSRSQISAINPFHNKGINMARAALVLAGFDASGKKLRILVPSQGTSAAQGGYVLGRHAALVDEIVTGKNISRRHARIIVESGRCSIEDMNSLDGTRVNGRHLTAFAPTPIVAGDMVSIGDIDMQVSGGE